jgi:indolepyruvate ferredoxin oxidoreductase alpha subunit
MGAAISQAAGFYQAFKNEEKRPDIVATIGDSTFFHAGIPPLIDALVQKVPFVLVILDNRTTAMTGNQPTPATGSGACGEPLETVDIKALVKGCGVKFCKEGNPYNLEKFVPLVKEAVQYSRAHGPAVVIAAYPCVIDLARKGEIQDRFQVVITDTCDGCAYCVNHFECPALVLIEEEERVDIDRILCSNCGVCISVCPKHSIELVQGQNE